MKLEKTYAAGVYLLNSFTWSKAIDNASGHLETSNGDNSRVNYRNVPGEKGLGGYDQPFNNTRTLVWDVPYGKGRRWGSGVKACVDAILGGWRVTGINTMTSGQPINISYSAPTAFQVLRRAPLTGPTTRRRHLFAREKPGELLQQGRHRRARPAERERSSQPFGNLGRNVARTESIFNFDGGAHKEFALPMESWRLQFRAEFFNLFNTTNLGAAASNVSCDQLRHHHGSFQPGAPDSVRAEAGVLVAIRPQAQSWGRARCVPASSPTQWNPSRASHS